MDKDKEYLLKYFMPQKKYTRITDVKNFPDLWKKIYFSTNKIKEFKKIYASFDIFPKLTKYINTNLVDILFLNVDEKEYMIIKIYNKETNDYSYYGGENPMISNLNLLNHINLPKNFNDFYHKFLNGFYDIEFGHLGLFPTDQIDCLDDDEWELIDEDINKKNYYIFFDNGSGCYIASNKYNFNSFIAYSDMHNSDFINFEKTIDEWIYKAIIEE